MTDSERAYVVAWWNKKHYDQRGCPLVGNQKYEDAVRIVSEYEAANPREAKEQNRDWGMFSFGVIYNQADTRTTREKFHEATLGCKIRNL